MSTITLLVALLRELRTPSGRRRLRVRARAAIRARAGRPRRPRASLGVHAQVAVPSEAQRAPQPLPWRPRELAERLARRARRAPLQGEDAPAPHASAGSTAPGRTIRQRYGDAFYSAIGSRGGNTVLEERGVTWLQDIGARGGAATRQRYGPDHYAEIGRKGGLAGRGSKRPRKPAEAANSSSREPGL